MAKIDEHGEIQKIDCATYMNVPSSKREIVRALFQADSWLDLYKLHEQYQLSPGVIAQTVLFLKERDLLEVEGMNAKLSEAGKAWVFLNRKRIFYATDRIWVQPKQTDEARVDAKSPYLPRTRSLDKKFFQNLG